MVVAAVATIVAIAAQQGDVLFRATFDRFTTRPDMAANVAPQPGGIDSDLQLRMHPDVSGKTGNSLALTIPEYAVWPLEGNFRPDRGTVSFWVKPCNYTLADTRRFQMFFQAQAPGFDFFVYKYYQDANVVLFYINAGGEKHEVRAKADWKPGDWHRLDVTWDPNGMAIYADGRLTERVGDYVPEQCFREPAAFPRTLSGGRMTLNCTEGWTMTEEGRMTAFDDLEIRTHKLSAAEIATAFAERRPDLAVGLRPVAPAKPEDVVRLTYRAVPTERRIAVRLDLAALPLTRQGDFAARLALADVRTGRSVVSNDVVFADVDSTVDILLDGLTLVPGEYEVRAFLPEFGVTSRARLRVPDMFRLKDRVAVDGAVPEPWIPVEDIGNGSFAVLDRVYSFDEGPFPSSVVSRGKEVMAKRPTLLLGGQPVVWTRTMRRRMENDRIELESSGSCGDFAFTGRTELWFDGFCRTDVTCRQTRVGAALDSLRLVWSVPFVAARHLLTPAFRAWREGRYDGRFGVDRGADSCLWLTGSEVGLLWWCESEANWVRGADADLHVVRGGAAADVCVDLISAAVSPTNEWRYAMAFQATPPRRPDRSYRVREYGDAPLSDWTTCGWMSSSGQRAPDNIRHWTSLEPSHPEDFRSFLESRRKDGIDVVVYSMPAHLCPLDPEWDWFYPSWKRQPGNPWMMTDEETGEPTSVSPCCAQTGAADMQLANLVRLFESQPLLKGVYFDISSVGACNNTLHGDGGTDAFGKPFASSTALHLREYFLRAAKICRRHGRWLHVHAHNLYFPFVHAFADACWPGEEQYADYLANPLWHYVEGISDDEYQAAWNPEIRGMGIYFIPQNQRAKDLQPAAVAQDPEAFLGRDAVLGTLMMSLLYDFKCLGMFGDGSAPLVELRRALKPLALDHATFLGHWNGAPVTTAAGIRPAFYRWNPGDGPCPFLVVVGNVSRESRATGLSVDWKGVGCAPTRLRDLMTGRVFTEAEVASAELRPHNFMLLVGER